MDIVMSKSTERQLDLNFIKFKLLETMSKSVQLEDDCKYMVKLIDEMMEEHHERI